jgi:hypothetical protein
MEIRGQVFVALIGVSMKQFVLDFLKSETTRLDGARAYEPIGHDADLHIQLKGGRQFAFYVMNRAVRLPEIRDAFEHNSARQLYTLFIVDQRILPAHGTQEEAPYWVSALHALAQGRIYAYRCEGRAVTITPLHLDWRWGNETRHFQYGPPVSISGLRGDTLDCSSKYIVGRFAVATFGDPAFWHKRLPQDEGRGQSYSWRNFSFNSERKRRAPDPKPEETWDAWEEFTRNYNPNREEEFEFNFDWSSMGGSGGSRGSTGGTRQQYHVVNAQNYALLGISMGASLDEVKRAYRQKAREFHPDMHPPARRTEYTAKMAEINLAFEAILKGMSRE